MKQLSAANALALLRGKTRKPSTKTDYAQALFWEGENNQICVSDEALNLIENSFQPYIVGTIGPPGAGKSTVCTVAYSIQRKEQLPYFERSDSQFSFTHGLWCLRDSVKQDLRAKYDKLDFLDAEGASTTNTSHYFSMLSFVLCAVVVLFSADARLDAMCNILDSMAAAVKLMKEYGTAIPFPDIYIPVEEIGWKIRDGIIPREEVPAFVLAWYPDLAQARIFTFQPLPKVTEEDPLYNDNYRSRLEKLMGEWKRSAASRENLNNINIVDRAKYARVLCKGLNSHSPQCVYDANREFFQAYLETQHKNLANKTEALIREEHSGVQVTSSKMTYEDFLKYPAKSFQDQFYESGRASPYFHKDFEPLLCGYQCDITPRVVDLYKIARETFLAIQRKQSETFKGDLQDFARAEIKQHLASLPLTPGTNLLDIPEELATSLQLRQGELQAQIDTEYRDTVCFDYQACWKALAEVKQSEWDSQIAEDETSFENFAKVEHTRLRANTEAHIRAEHQDVPVASYDMSLKEFLKTATYDFEAQFHSAVKKSPHYRRGFGFEEKLVKFHCRLDAAEYLKELFQEKLDAYRKVQQQKVNDMNLELESFAKSIVESHLLELTIDQHLPSQPSWLLRSFQERQDKCRRAVDTSIRDSVTFPFNEFWERSAQDTKIKWNLRIDAAKWRYRAAAGGPSKCKNCECEIDHSGVRHTECDGSHLWWVDGPSRRAICDRCDKLVHLTDLVCGGCKKPSGCYLIDIPA